MRCTYVFFNLLITFTCTKDLHGRNFDLGILASFGIHRVPYATNDFDLCETHSKGLKDWKMIWFIHVSSMCCCIDKQTQIETQRIFQFQFSSLYSFQCNNQRNIKAGSEYPTPTKFVLQRHKFLLLVIKPNIFYYLRPMCCTIYVSCDFK